MSVLCKEASHVEPFHRLGSRVFWMTVSSQACVCVFTSVHLLQRKISESLSLHGYSTAALMLCEVQIVMYFSTIVQS